MIWLALFMGFCTGTVTTAVLFALLVALREEDDWQWEEAALLWEAECYRLGYEPEEVA